ncbi:MAG TPA: hypothetical protein VEW48_07385, partial [Thermoanaerobaculia bacterium]|nr:hypothetical protein [Thermoanaerobaculia bacterium]
MSDDPWTRELTQVNRENQDQERSRLDERWDRLSSGELSAEEEEELRALAAASEEAREAWEAFRPLGPDFHAGVVQAIREQGSVPAEPLPFRRRASRLVGWGSLAAAAAAAVVVLLVRPAAPLPWYSLEVSGGVRTSRGEEAEAVEVPVLKPGDHFTIVLRPATETAGKGLDAQCFVLRGGDLRGLQVVRREIDSVRGAVRMESMLGRDLQPGVWTLWAVV